MTLREEIIRLSNGVAIETTSPPPISPDTVKEVNKLIEKVRKVYNDKLGYNIGPIKLKTFNFFKKFQPCNEPVPASVPSNNDSILYLETTVLENIKDWDELEKIIIHELAHLATNKEHEDKEFAEAIQKYKDKTGIEAVVNPENLNVDYSNSFPNFQEKLETFRKLNSPARRKAHDEILKQEQKGLHARLYLEPIKNKVKLIKKATV